MSTSLIVDIYTGCPHKCYYCYPHYFDKIKTKYMPLDKYRALVDMVIAEGKKIRHILPYLSGEPILHKDFFEILSYTAQKDLSCTIATKLGLKMDFARLEKVFLDFLIHRRTLKFDITVDGLPEDILKNAKNIDYGIVWDNLERLSKLVNSGYGNYVKCSLRTVVTSYNENNLDLIEKRLKGLGFDGWFAKAMGYYCLFEDEVDLTEVEKLLPTNPKWRARISIEGGAVKHMSKKCKFVGVPVISPDGQLTICCHDMMYKVNCGNIFEAGGIDVLLQSLAYKEAAALGAEKKLDICRGCN